MMLRSTDRSRDDLEMAFAWYERQRRGLGFDFLDCVETAIQNIITYPEMYQIRYRDFRGCPIRRFPFSIFYTIEQNEIVLHPIFDNPQDPKRKP